MGNTEDRSEKEKNLIGQSPYARKAMVKTVHHTPMKREAQPSDSEFADAEYEHIRAMVRDLMSGIPQSTTLPGILGHVHTWLQTKGIQTRVNRAEAITQLATKTANILSTAQSIKQKEVELVHFFKVTARRMPEFLNAEFDKKVADLKYDSAVKDADILRQRIELQRQEDERTRMQDLHEKQLDMMEVDLQRQRDELNRLQELHAEEIKLKQAERRVKEAEANLKEAEVRLKEASAKVIEKRLEES